MPVPIVTENHLFLVSRCLGPGKGDGRWGEVANYSSPSEVVFCEGVFDCVLSI